MGRAKLEALDQRFGRLVVVEFMGVSPKREALWRCHCDCGNEKVLPSYRLRYVKSCGCLMREYRKQPKEGFRRRHGQAKRREKPATYLYTLWVNLIGRCENPRHHSYPEYGGRGIRVCPRWRDSFEDFIRDVGSRPSLCHSLDRLDNS